MHLDLNTLYTFLEKDEYEPQNQEETNQICLLLKITEREFPLFFRIFETSDLLQLLAFMPCQIKENLYGDLGRMLHLVNKELDIPGFGMDEDAGVCFYRCMLPTPNKKIDPSLLKGYIKSIELICESLSAPIIAVATGYATYEEILAKAKR